MQGVPFIFGHHEEASPSFQPPSTAIHNRSVRASSLCGRLFIAVLLALVFRARPASAQIDTGSLTGAVQDASGARISSAKVVLHEEQTGLVQTQTVKQDGTFDFAALKIGTYTITASAPGFDTLEKKHIGIAIQQALEVTLNLKPGGANETVVVNADSVELQTQDASVGQVVSEREINNLPLNGRNYTLLAQLAPGTTTTVYDSGHGEVQSGSFTANGMLTVYNNYLLDGITNNNMTADFGNGNSFTLKPPPDGLAEFKVWKPRTTRRSTAGRAAP